jgi:hypothetical protein
MLPLFVKPLVLVALYELVSRIAAVSVLNLGLVAPIADAIARITGLDPRYAAFIVLAVIAGSLFKVVTAVYGVLTTPVKH